MTPFCPLFPQPKGSCTLPIEAVQWEPQNSLHSNQKIQHLPSPPCPPHLKGPKGRGTTAISPQIPIFNSTRTLGEHQIHLREGSPTRGSELPTIRFSMGSGKISLLWLQGRAKRSGGCKSFCAGIHQPHTDHGAHMGTLEGFPECQDCGSSPLCCGFGLFLQREAQRPSCKGPP